MMSLIHTVLFQTLFTNIGHVMLFLQKVRPMSAGSKPNSAQGAKMAGMAGLNSEEIKIVRRTKEEEQRRGGWIRIFPGPDTWDVYG
jgi:tubulin polyglutamylase TTLL5